MDNFVWDNTPTATSEMNFPPCMWGNQQNDASENSIQSSVNYGAVIAGNVDLAEALFNASEEPHGVKTSESRKLDGVSEMVRLLLPPSRLEESMSSTPAAVEASQCPEAQWLAAAVELAALEAVVPWRDAITSLGHLNESFGIAKESQIQINIGDEEDVSAMLSNCDSIPNLSCSGNVSSGESEKCSSRWSDKGSHHHRCSNVDEVVSRGSSNPDATRFGPSQSRPDLKRKERETNECTAAEGRLYCDVLQSDSSTTEGGFRIFFENQSKGKKPRSDKYQQRASSIDFRLEEGYEPDAEAIAQVKEMIYRAAAMRPVNLGTVEAMEKPKRKNVRISSDPQTVAARHRRERISERLRVLQRLVPGGSKMDTASMLDEAANYLKFLKSQVSALETLGQGIGSMTSSSSSSLPLSSSLSQNFPMQTLYPKLQALERGHPQKGIPTTAPYHLHF